MTQLLTLQGQLFILLLTGAFFRKYIVGEGFQAGLTDVIINLILPCNTVTSFLIEMNGELAQSTLSILVVSLMNQIFCLILAAFLFRGCREENQPAMKFGLLCSNAGFLGIPVAEGIWSDKGVLLTAIFLIPQRIFMWTAGVGFFQKENGKHTIRKFLKNPCIDSVIIGFILAVTQFRLPAALDQAISAFSRCNTGMSMFLIGMIASRIKPRDFMNKEIFYLSTVRLLLLPLTVLLGCRVLNIDGLTTGVSVILTAMPIGGTTAVLATKYDRNPEFAASCIAVSTVLSLIVIPLWGLVLN